MTILTHDGFRDVAMKVVSEKVRKAGFVDVVFYWIYPADTGGVPYNRQITDRPTRMRINKWKWEEFYAIHSNTV